MNSKDLFERSKKVSPGGVHSPVRSFASVGGTPVFFQKAEGAKLFDVEGKEYIDYCQSFGPLLFGHRHPDIADVVRETVETAWSFGACEPYSLELAEFITSRIPWVEKIRFVNSGTEAVMSALRVARASTGRNKILKFDGCYHGHLDALLVKAGSGLAGQSSTDSAGIGEEMIKNTLVLPLDDESALEALFQKEGDLIAAVIIEPLPANYGLLIQRKEFIQKIAALAKKHEALLLFDEVISGFRVGFQGMAGELGIEPDLVCYGKILGGGFPVGAYAGKAVYMDLVAPSGPVYQAGTLSANPFGMRAGLACLKKAWNENPYKTLEKNCSDFTHELSRIFDRYTGIKWQAVSYGSLFWFKEYSDTSIRNLTQIPGGHKNNFAKLFHALLKEGVYLAPSGYEVGFLSTVHTKEILQETLNKAESGLKKEYSK
ncbi:glutamate-1-semialdehyde 2,1-aminomutase [Leptospira ilyithenensis]|uniref:Glutamate-1-semialdehyde 2,1-aminomutase n=1 Tax=Leptospira ilyithenensis TaxID=2484901 RepID=A0A4R9LS55_9LEPT|nr:glutamate-1-semialdehyde 2,1-aminomutase [Leptospira ilyithenensis]TGN11649.1 glutamate-1-semialdehyde 2,1-aminomutase [Leptospira ilyithenensis]